MGTTKHQLLCDPGSATSAFSGTPTSSATFSHVGARRTGSRKIVVRNLALAAPFRLWSEELQILYYCLLVHPLYLLEQVR